MKYHLFLLLFTCCNLLFSQRSEFNNLSGSKSVNPSNILNYNVNLAERLLLKNALYNSKKNNLPYYLHTTETNLNEIAIPELKVKSSITLSVSLAEFIKNNYSNYLKNNYFISNNSIISSSKRINNCEVIPFRINEFNQVEELIDYEITWKKKPSAERISTTTNFKNNSVLASGKWYKIAITSTGVHKISHSFLVNAGIPIAGINPKNIRIYGNGGQQLAEKNMNFRYDDLEENAIQVVGENDNSFDNGDYILFYAHGTTTWQKTNLNSGLIFKHFINNYSDTAFYYLNFDIGTGKRVAVQNSLATPPNVTTNSFDYYNFHELDKTNFVKSGRNFYGEYFDFTTNYNFSFNDNNFIVGDTIRSECTIAGRGTFLNTYNVNGNGINFNISCNGLNISNYLEDYAAVKTGSGKSLNTNPNTIGFNISKQTANAVGYLDKLTVNARRNLVFNGPQFSFRDLRTTGTGNICEYQLSAGNTDNINIWNVTDQINPTKQLFTIAGNNFSFVSSSDSLNEYIIFNDFLLPQPVYYGEVANQNLHALQQADYVIVTPPQFLAQANRLAVLHQQNEGLTYAVVTTNQVYNEFGSGKADAAAIRDFTRMLYTRGAAISKPTKYLLLFGRGSYHNKNGRSGNSNLIPTYQSENSVSVIYSVASDDFYSLMDDNEGELAESFGGMDLGVGRLVVSTVSQAEEVTRKIENYYKKGGLPPLSIDNCNITEKNQLMGDWRNYLLFCADDGDLALHMWQADNLSNKVKNSNPAYNIDKVYIDAYKGLSTPGGKRYPDMVAAFNNRINKGCLIMNYTGHGGEVGLSAERVVDIPGINSWTNFNNLPLFITATCEFSRYDDPDRISAGEICLLNPRGGSIAMLTTCRLAFSNFNETLNNRLFDFVFKKQANNKMPTLGDIIKNTKAYLGQNFFYSNFHLLGDPALTLAYPQNKVFTSEINGNSVTPTSTDTIKGLSKVTIKGFVADTTGLKLTNFNGFVYPMVFDKKEIITCQLNDPGSSISSGTLVPFKFIAQQNIIYKGKAEVKNGDFTFSFMVPKDVSFSYGNAKISYYATDGYSDAQGNHDSVKVGGLDPNAIPDVVGPQVKLYLNSKTFVNGGTTNQNPILMAEVTDSSGINTVGTGFGHDITAIIDNNSNLPYVLNDYYETNLNSYQSGIIRYQLSDLEEGPHQLSLKVWDVQNNSSLTTTDFVVAKSADLALNMVLNYPNPFTTNTKFFFEHNRNCDDIKVLIQVFTISGKIAKSISTTINCEGFRNEGIVWDGKDDFGDKLGRGVYLYKVSISDRDNKKAEKIEKLVILN